VDPENGALLECLLRRSIPRKKNTQKVHVFGHKEGGARWRLVDRVDSRHSRRTGGFGPSSGAWDLLEKRSLLPAYRGRGWLLDRAEGSGS